MDPNATLKRIRELTRLIGPLTAGEAGELRDLVIRLDEWLSEGGLFPRDWMPF
jgi:hypothetical protein